MTFIERLRVAVRYTFAFGQGHLSAFLSSLSMLGLVLAISLLIIVLSVMNGFDKEMRETILSLVPHITVYPDAPVADGQAVVATLRSHPSVLSVAPFAQFDALVMHGTTIETVRGVGLDPSGSDDFSSLVALLDADEFSQFQEQPDALILGAGVAKNLGVEAGERLNLIVPGADHTQAARFQAVKLVAILTTRTELDQTIALVPLPLASDLAGLHGKVTGFRVTTRELFDVQRTSLELQQLLPVGYYAIDWMMTHGNLYSAIQLSRDLVTILLFSIIAVAAFNVVSSLVLVVLDKQGNIAILRTLGATGGDIASIFVMQGAMIGVVGVVLGSVVGMLGSFAVPYLVRYLEQLLGMQFLNTDVYPVSFLPVDLLARDILTVSAIALGMCVTAAIYPARRAAALAPALILNQDR